HDTRLKNLYKEVGIYEDYFIDYDDPDLWQKVRNKAEELLKSPESIQNALKIGYDDQLKRAQKNKNLLKEFLKISLNRAGTL
ncbi:MAG: hypothetical protein Q8S06_08435, partial [Methanobacteriaceae archaeon]|nr:hypothetical protein [Methanobacteriaceae archaeon]